MSAAENVSPSSQGPFVSAASSTSNTRGASPQPADTELISILVASCTIAGSMELGDIGADRGGFRERRIAVLERRHLAHRIDGEIFRRLLRAFGNIREHAL